MEANPQIEKTFVSPLVVTEVAENNQVEKEYFGASYLRSFASETKNIEDYEFQRGEDSQNTSSAVKPFKEANIQRIKLEFSGREYSRVKHQWEGCITKVLEKTFLADLVNEDDDELTAKFDIDDVSEDDKELIQVNNIFYWSIGHRTTQGNQRINEEIIIFRRLPAWRKFNINKPSEKAKKFIEFFTRPEIQLSSKKQRN